MLDRKRGINVLDELRIMVDHLPAQFTMEIVIMGCWNLWMQRNAKIFGNITPSVQSWRIQLRNDLQLILLRTKNKHRNAFEQWIEINLLLIYLWSSLELVLANCVCLFSFIPL